MKFEYDEDDDKGECVAFISKSSGRIVMDVKKGHIEIGPSGYFYKGDAKVSDLIEHADKKFYPGDKITITF